MIDFKELYTCYRELKPEILEEVAKLRCQEWVEEIDNSLKLT